MKTASLLLAIVIMGSFLVGGTQAGDHGGDGEPYNAKLSGVIETMPANGQAGTWVIGGHAIDVLPHTAIDERHGAAAIGRYVEVKGEQAGAQFTAYAIDVEEIRGAASRMTRAKFYGLVEERPQEGAAGRWRVNGRELLVSQETRIKEKYGPATVGSYVEVEGEFAGKNFAVSDIEVKDHDHHNAQGAYNNKFSGTIESMPAEGYEGQWVVAGRQLEVNKGTVIDETAGKASQGGQARVKGVRAGATIKAAEIKIIAAR